VLSPELVHPPLIHLLAPESGALGLAGPLANFFPSHNSFEFPKTTLRIALQDRHNLASEIPRLYQLISGTLLSFAIQFFTLLQLVYPHSQEHSSFLFDLLSLSGKAPLLEVSPAETFPAQ
jgi:hypothetical protein